jgi:hypothetical protein
MTDAGTQPSDPQRPVLLTVVRTITPVLATATTYALARSNIHLLRNPTVETIINVVLSAVVGLVWTAVFRWLEAHKATWWGKAFLIADGSLYPTAPVASSAAAPMPPPRADGGSSTGVAAS